MDSHSRLLLESSAILHDVGNYINSARHHRHSHYIISNSEMFGYSRGDIRIISNVVYYHRKSMPTPGHFNFISLRREERMQVLKLAAMLRLADGLDRGHSQRIETIRLEKAEDEMLLHAEYEGDPSVERTGLKLKSEMFEEVFGYRVRLV